MCTLIAVLLGNAFFARPAVLLSRAMKAIPVKFDFSESRGRQSKVREMAEMHGARKTFSSLSKPSEIESVDSMQLALRSFGKFTPTVMVREMLSRKMEAGDLC